MKELDQTEPPGTDASEGVSDHSNIVLDQYMPYRINVLAAAISNGLEDIIADRFGIAIPEWRVIVYLQYHAPVSSGNIAEQTHMDKAKVSRSVSRLEKAGLVIRKVNPSDRRLVELTLSRKGKRLYEQLKPIALKFETEMLSTFSAEEGAMLSQLLEKLEHHLNVNTLHVRKG